MVAEDFSGFPTTRLRIDEELELDVVGIAEHDDQRSRDAARFGDGRVLHRVTVEMCTPLDELGAIGDCEREVVEARRRLVEAAAGLRAVLDEPQADGQAVMTEEDLTTLIARVPEPSDFGEAEHSLVPARAPFDIGDRQPEVMHARELTRHVEPRRRR